MPQKFTFYKDSTSFSNYDFDPMLTANKVREDLIAKGFMTASESPNYRFLNYQNTALSYNDMVIGLGSEGFVPLQGIEGTGSQIYLTNVTKTTNSDLIGFNTNWFYDRYASARVTLNSSVASNAGKFQPLMLTNVKTANPDIPGVAFENVVVCQKDSIISFGINSWGSAGYGYKIAPSAGTPINEYGLYITFAGCPAGGNFASTGLSRYYVGDESINQQTIRVVSTESMNLGGGKTLEYMKFSVKTWNVTQYTRSSDDSVHTCNLPIPTPTSDGRAAEDGGGGVPYGELANAPTGTTVVPGDSIQPGSTVPGSEKSTQTFGGGIYNLVGGDPTPNNIIGEVIFYIFVFKTEADAKAVITGVNSIDPNLWS